MGDVAAFIVSQELITLVERDGLRFCLLLMGLTDTGKNRKILAERLARFTQCTVTIDDPKCRYDGCLLIGVRKEKETEHFSISRLSHQRSFLRPLV